MKYLFIFLPFFAFGQDTIAFPDGDTLINGQLTYGGDSTLYGIRTQPNTRLDSGFLAESVSYQQLYIEDRSFELIDSFRYNGAYYELRDNGWYKQILPGCDSHITNEYSVMNRDKIELCKVKVLVWTGCSLIEVDAVRFCGYNYDATVDDLAPIKDYIVSYRIDGRWIKPSHVIKEL